MGTSWEASQEGDHQQIEMSSQSGGALDHRGTQMGQRTCQEV